LGQSVQPPREDDWNRFDKILREKAVDMGNPQETAQARDQVLTGSARQGFGRFDDVIVDRAWQQSAQIGESPGSLERVDMQSSQNQGCISKSLGSLQKTPQKNSWVSSGSGNLPSE
jgi:hypothetical protein